jgi:hypothetical protein
MDMDYIPYKPSNISVNETLKSLLSKKQETAKKTFGLFTDIKGLKNREHEFNTDRKCKI